MDTTWGDPIGKNKTILLIIFLIFLSTQFYSQIENSDKREEEELEEILKKCAEYCEMLDNSVLYFICKEKIAEDIFRGDSFAMETGTAKEL